MLLLDCSNSRPTDVIMNLASSISLRAPRKGLTHHLTSQKKIQYKASHKPIENQLVVHLLQRRIDPRQAPKKVIEDL